MVKKYKYITIMQNDGELFNQKPCYRIYNTRALKKVDAKFHAQIGIISWYAPWKEYVFSSQAGCIFNNSCLRDVIDFLENHAK